MSHCVPDWDGSGGELDAVLPTTDFTLPVKGKWELSHKRSHLSDLAFVPTHDAIEPEWADEGHVVAMQGHSGKGNKAMWQQMNYQNAWSTVQESEDAVTPVKPVSSSSPGKEPVLVVNEPAVDPHHGNTLNMQEDEMVSWLQYPLDDSLERNYCSEFFGELPNSNISNMQLMKDSFGGQNQAGGRNNRNPGPVNGSNSINSRVSSADAAMAMGAGRAAGLLPQTGVEAFTKVRTTLQYGGKWSPSQNNAGKTLGAAPSTQAPSPSRSPPMSGNQSTPMLPPKSQGLNFQPPRTTGPMNFSHFSRPAAVMKASLQCLGMSHGVAPHGTGTNVRLKSQSYSGKPPVDGSTSSGSSIAESTTTRQRSGAFRKEQEVQVEASEAQQSLGTESSWPSMQNSLSGKDADAVNSSADGVDSDSKPGVADADNCRNSSISDSAVLGTEKHQSQGAEVQEAPEPTITSSSGGSGNSAERGKEAASSGKRRTREGEESECQSEVSNLLQPQVSQVGAVAHRQDGEDEMAQLKKPQQRGSTTKRSRAAEVHNLSERRRRDRINEKMKALQELIPNSNKTDKASMLDEAIEYLKMLQLQLQQMMSMRSGMSIPSMVMPAGMQHLQIPQLPQMGPMPPMGMGMGMGMGPMGMGMSMMDMGGGAPGRPMMSLPSHSGPSHSQHNVSATSPAVSVVDTHDYRLQNLQNPSVMESLNVFMAQHRQMQMAPQPISMDAFNAYMMHHQQQQHHQQHQQHQLQHQHQHSLHHLPSNMGGGAPQ